MPTRRAIMDRARRMLREEKRVKHDLYIIHPGEVVPENLPPDAWVIKLHDTENPYDTTPSRH